MGSSDKELAKIRGKGFTSPGKLYIRKSTGETESADP